MWHYGMTKSATLYYWYWWLHIWDMDNLSKLHTYAKLMYDHGVQEVGKQLVHDLGAIPQHEANKKDYEEGGGENDMIIIL